MANRKITRKYYFSTSGETEQWYFDWLEKQINKEFAARCHVSLSCKKKSPDKYAKGETVTQPIVVTHVFDYESNDAVHSTHFKTTLDKMKDAGKYGKSIKYKSGYSNFAFELWMVLHKSDCYGHLTHRSHYLVSLNKAYGENFENLHQFKHESNFKRILRKLSLADVKDAVNRARVIAERNEEHGFSLIEYKGYSYYRENPSLSLWESVAKIISDCGL